MTNFFLLASLEGIRTSSLVLGIIGIATGILLMMGHRHSFDNVINQETDSRIRKFETRKFRRRATVAAMVASTGCMMSALYWVTEARIFAIFILLILSLLVGILGIAFIDLFSVSLQTMTRTDDAERRKIVEDYLRQREQAASEDSDE